MKSWVRPCATYPFFLFILDNSFCLTISYYCFSVFSSDKLVSQLLEDYSENEALLQSIPEPYEIIYPIQIRRNAKVQLSTLDHRIRHTVRKISTIFLHLIAQTRNKHPSHLRPQDQTHSKKNSTVFLRLIAQTPNKHTPPPPPPPPHLRPKDQTHSKKK